MLLAPCPLLPTPCPWPTTPCPLLPTPQPSSPSHSATPSLWLRALNLSSVAPFTETGSSCEPPDHDALHYLGLQQ